MASKIKADQLSVAIARELSIVNDDTVEMLKRIAKKKASELVKKTKATAPVGKRSKHYRDNITFKKTEETNRKITYTWYVKGSDYRLSHLLNNGHALRNGGRYAGTKFITKAYEPIEKEYAAEVEEALKNGN